MGLPQEISPAGIICRLAVYNLKMGVRPTALSLFSGIGLHDLGLEWAGFEIIGQCEIDPFCTTILERHWPNAPRWKDVKDVSRRSVIERCGRLPSLVTGGFPCQEVSVAGKGEGIGTPDKPTPVSGLWWQMRRVVADIGPKWVLVENVPALRVRGADRVLSSMEQLGYSCWPLVVGAWAVGASHCRNRAWIVCERGLAAAVPGGNPENGTETETLLADADGPGRQNEIPPQPMLQEHPAAECRRPYRWPSWQGEEQCGWEAARILPRRPRGTAEPGLGGPTDGSPRGVDAGRITKMLKALGNANPPQVVAAIGRAMFREYPS